MKHFRVTLELVGANSPDVHEYVLYDGKSLDEANVKKDQAYSSLDNALWNRSATCPFTLVDGGFLRVALNRFLAISVRVHDLTMISS